MIIPKFTNNFFFFRITGVVENVLVSYEKIKFRINNRHNRVYSETVVLKNIKGMLDRVYITNQLGESREIFITEAMEQMELTGASE